MFRFISVFAMVVLAQPVLAPSAQGAEEWVLTITSEEGAYAGGPLEAVASPSTGELFLRYGSATGGASTSGRWRALRYGGFPGDFTGVWDTTEPASGFPNTASLEIEAAPAVPNIPLDVYSVTWPNGDAGWLVGEYPYAVGGWNIDGFGMMNVNDDGTVGMGLFVPDGAGLTYALEMEWYASAAAGSYAYRDNLGNTGTITLTPVNNLLEVTINAPNGILRGSAMQMIPGR